MDKAQCSSFFMVPQRSHAEITKITTGKQIQNKPTPKSACIVYSCKVQEKFQCLN